jgi:hypothetical protein
MNDHRSAKAKLPGREMAALCIKAWNHHVRGSEIRVLKWAAGGNEPFPTIDGLEW